MSQNDGNNLNCGCMIATVIACTVITVLMFEPKKSEDYFVPIILGLIIGYVVTAYLNSSDRFKGKE